MDVMKRRLELRGVVLVLAAAVTVLPGNSWAAIATYDSIEWLCQRMPHIAIMRAAVVADLQPPCRDCTDRSCGFDAKFERVEIISGRPPQQAIDWCSKPRLGSECLVFFDDSLGVTAVLALDDSSSCGGDAVTADFRRLEGRPTILSAVKRLMARPPIPHSPGSPRWFTVVFPSELEIASGLWNTSASFVRVPAGHDYYGRLLRNLESADVRVRTASAYALISYACPNREDEFGLWENCGDRRDVAISSLRALLRDPACQEGVTRSGARVRFYPVRQAAYTSLRELRVDEPEPEGFSIDAPLLSDLPELFDDSKQR